MMSGMTDLRINDNPELQRYEGYLGDVLVGLADYRVDGDRVLMPHTETQPAYQGRGIAGDIVRFALDDIRTRGRRVVPACPYVAHWIEDHPQYADLVA